MSRSYQSSLSPQEIRDLAQLFQLILDREMVIVSEEAPLWDDGLEFRPLTKCEADPETRFSVPSASPTFMKN